MEQMLKGKCALVTGASRGIGRQIALTFAGYGASLILNYNGSRDRAVHVADEARALGADVLLVQADVSQKEECSRMFKEALAAQRHIDILVNNAGITRDNIAVRMSEEEFRAVVDTNLVGTFFCMQQAAKIMMKTRLGRIINISSISGVHGNAGQINYSAAKAGVIGMTKSLARELASRYVTVNAIAPGYIDTEMTEVLPERVKSDALDRIPLGRLGTPEDIAEMAAFLASDHASYITGQVIAVDGGMGM